MAPICVDLYKGRETPADLAGRREPHATADSLAGSPLLGITYLLQEDLLEHSSNLPLAGGSAIGIETTVVPTANEWRQAWPGGRGRGRG